MILNKELMNLVSVASMTPKDDSGIYAMSLILIQLKAQLMQQLLQDGMYPRPQELLIVVDCFDISLRIQVLGSKICFSRVNCKRIDRGDAQLKAGQAGTLTGRSCGVN